MGSEAGMHASECLLLIAAAERQMPKLGIGPELHVIGESVGVSPAVHDSRLLHGHSRELCVGCFSVTGYFRFVWEWSRKACFL